MKIEEEFEVASSPEVTFRELNDVGGIGHCIAGVQDVTVLNDDESQWKIQVRAGFMALTVKLNARIVERVEPRRFAFMATGQDVELSGFVELEPIAAGTRCKVSIDAQIGGPLGPLADLMARGPQEQLVAETVQNIRKRLPAAEPVVDEAPAPSAATAQAPTDRREPTKRPRPELVLPSGSHAVLAAGGALVILGFLLGRRSRS